MAAIKKIIPINRVEGDLEIYLELDRDNIVRTAKSVGTMYRGIENLMSGRSPLDSLVITPRICGICTTSHLNAAAMALDAAYGVTIPADAQRLRNVTLMVEQLQNDLRHLFLLFMPDFTRPHYAHHPLFESAQHRYLPLKGKTAIATIRETQNLIEIIAILGGQWPHSSFMVPGGVVSVPNRSDIAQCRQILTRFRRWYEKRILGCSIDRWKTIRNEEQLQAWLDEKEQHKNGELGFLTRICLDSRLHKIGRSHDRFISAGGPELPTDDGNLTPLFPAGVVSMEGTEPLDLEMITEDVSHSFFKDTDGHPFVSRTIADTHTTDEEKYSWAKAPRYKGKAAETGPLADLLMADDPLFASWVRCHGASVFVRELARMVRPALTLPVIEQSLAGMDHADARFYTDSLKPLSAKSVGTVSAPRGMLGHWLVIENGKIANYQVITPTTWNGSPRDKAGICGPWEQAITGTRVDDPDNPVEVEQIVRSFDPCMVCTVHAIQMSSR